MSSLLRCTLLGALVLSPATALAQGLVELLPPGQETAVVVEEPAVVVEEPEVVEEPVIVQEPVVVQEPRRQRPRVVRQAVVVQEPVVVEEPIIIQQDDGIYEEDARAIAMMNGMVDVDEVNQTWRGNFEVEGTDGSGENLEITIDADTGAVLDIDD